jgi:hypothetical protein
MKWEITTDSSRYGWKVLTQLLRKLGWTGPFFQQVEIRGHDEEKILWAHSPGEIETSSVRIHLYKIADGKWTATEALTEVTTADYDLEFNPESAIANGTTVQHLALICDRWGMIQDMEIILEQKFPKTTPHEVIHPWELIMNSGSKKLYDFLSEGITIDKAISLIEETDSLEVEIVNRSFGLPNRSWKATTDLLPEINWGDFTKQYLLQAFVRPLRPEGWIKVASKLGKNIIVSEFTDYVDAACIQPMVVPIMVANPDGSYEVTEFGKKRYWD